jgi:hypothetical protein
MTIFALCVFSGGLPRTDSDAGAEALRAAGYEVIRLPLELKATLEVEGNDFIEVRREGNDDRDSRVAMYADLDRILTPFGGGWDGSGCETIAEMWAVDARIEASRKPPGRAHLRVVGGRGGSGPS